VWWYQPLPTNYLLGYFPGPIPTDSDYFEFQVALRVLSGELNTRLREEEAISYAAYAPFLDFARPAGGIYTSTPDPARAIRVIRRTLSGLADLALLEGPAGLACGVAVDRFELEELAARTTSEGEADALARAYLFFGDIAGTGASARKLRRVGCPSIGDVMLRYVKHVQFVFLGDTAQLHGLR
jgi:predicted Zn-dependent peptidase